MTRSIKAAKAKLRDIHDQIERIRRRAAEYPDEFPGDTPDSAAMLKFFEFAKKESDCGSARNDGMLDEFEIGCEPPIMHPEFEDGCKNLQPMTMSNVVETKSGLHLIFRIR